MSGDKIKHLVVDTSAFIKGAALQELAEIMMTVPEVVEEVTSRRQLRRLVVLPYELIVKEVFPDSIKFVSEFAKKTGDYTSLSAVDIKVMALTYQLEKEKVGVAHLKTEPTAQRTVNVTGLGRRQAVDADEKQETCESSEGTSGSAALSACLDSLQLHSDEGENHIKQIESDEPVILSDDVEECLVPAQDKDNESGDGNDSESDDGDEWITPSNIQQKKKEMNQGDFFEHKNVEVACITTDFAMQNVLKQIGLNVTSIDGRLIRHVRTFIFRCTTCFKTTSIMTKVFCPKCGHATLKKVAVSVDEDGNQQIHINGRKPLTARGKRFSLPTPKGGQHFQYPILTEDQHIHKRNATRLARMKNNPLDPDYIAGYSPFTMRDVNSKSAVLGVRQDQQDMKQWMKKTTNDVRRKKK